MLLWMFLISLSLFLQVFVLAPFKDMYSSVWDRRSSVYSKVFPDPFPKSGKTSHSKTESTSKGVGRKSWGRTPETAIREVFSLVSFTIVVIKHPDKSSLSKEEFIWAQSSKSQSLIAGKS